MALCAAPESKVDPQGVVIAAYLKTFTSRELAQRVFQEERTALIQPVNSDSRHR